MNLDFEFVWDIEFEECDLRRRGSTWERGAKPTRPSCAKLKKQNATSDSRLEGIVIDWSPKQSRNADPPSVPSEDGRASDGNREQPGSA
jgi:hypothetical protein